MRISVLACGRLVAAQRRGRRPDEDRIALQRLVAAASVEQLVTLIEAFSPTRALGPDWTRSFEPLVERLWAWGDPTKLAAIEATFRARGPSWWP